MAAIQNLTVDQETIDDAVQAFTFLRAQHEIDPKQIYILGHSLGGYLAPRMAERTPEAAGIIILAGNTRPLEDIIPEQMQYLGAPPNQIAQAKQQASEIRNLTTAEGPPIMNAPRAYWLDLNRYDAKREAQKLHCRILVLQGARDYQVTQADYAGWQSALKGRPNVTFHLYPTLNHLFVNGKGRSLPAEYERPGHVSPEVINDIVSWIGRR